MAKKKAAPKPNLTATDVDQIKEIFSALQPPITISDTSINMTDDTDRELAIATGKLADAIKAIADKSGSAPRYGIYINQAAREES